MCVKKVLNIGQLSYGIFENYGVKETIYNLNSEIRFEKKENSEMHFNVFKSKKIIYIYTPIY